MNIFEEYLNKILDKIKLASEEKLILLPESLSGINVDIPPKKFKCDLSTNVAMVQDLIKTTTRNILVNKISTKKDVSNKKNQIVDFSNKLKITINEIRDFLRITMYNNKDVLKKNNEGKKIIKKLFNVINKNPKKYIKTKYLKTNKERAISDYISGMTDRYAIQLYRASK